jgi:transposase-like protein
VKITNKGKELSQMVVYQKSNGTVKRGTGTGEPARHPNLVEVVDVDRLHMIIEEGLMATCYAVGIDVMQQMLENDVDEIVGPKGKHNKGRTASRHGYENTQVVCGDKKISIVKPRVRGADGEIPLPSLACFQNESPLNEAVFTRVLSGISTRKYGRTVDEAGDASCISKSEVARRFKEALKNVIDEFFKRRLEEDYPIIMVDGIVRGGMTIVVALGITSGGEKQVLGIMEGGTENSLVVKALFDDLVNRGLKQERPRLFVLDGSKALSKAVNDYFGLQALIQRCQVHKKRNVLSHLPDSEQSNISLALSKAYLEFDYEQAKKQLELIVGDLEYRYPDAAASLREGLEETLTVHRLGLPALLRKTLSTTNPIESANSAASGIVRRITKWGNGEMVLRNMAAAFVEAERGFRRIPGYKQIPILNEILYQRLDSVQENKSVTACAV